MPDANFLLLCIIAAAVCVAAFTLDRSKNRLDEGLRELKRDIADLKRSIDQHASLQYDALTDIRDLLAGTPTTTLRKRIADYKERERVREEFESAVSDLPIDEERPKQI